MKKLLIVEDDASILSSLCALLEMEHFPYFSATNGKEALEILEKHQEEISLLITDINMPVMTGLELIKTIRAEERYSHLPVLVFSASLTAQMTVYLRANGIEQLHKPIDIDDLIRVIEQYLGKERGQISPPPPITI